MSPFGGLLAHVTCTSPTLWQMSRHVATCLWCQQIFRQMSRHVIDTASPRFQANVKKTVATSSFRAIHTFWRPPRAQVVGSSWQLEVERRRAARGAVAIVNARGALSTVRAGMHGVTLRHLPYAACAFVPRIVPRGRAARPPRGHRFEHVVKPCRTYCCVEVRMSFFQ